MGEEQLASPLPAPLMFLMLGKVGGQEWECLSLPGRVGGGLPFTTFLFPITYLGLSPFVVFLVFFSFFKFCCIFLVSHLTSPINLIAQSAVLGQDFCHCLPSMNVFILPAVGKWGVTPVFFPHLAPER